MIARVTVGLSRFVGGETDAHGNPVESWSEPEYVRVYGVYPRTNAEPNPDRDESVIGWSILAPSDFVASSRDRVIVPDGRVFEVEGEPLSYDSGPFGSAYGSEVYLKRVEG